jgi:hypothetical protein
MAGRAKEQELLSNKFGRISDKRIIFLSNKSLFTKGSQQEIPIKQVTSVKFHTQKPIIATIAGIVCLVSSFAIITIFLGNLLAVVAGIIILFLGVWIAYLGISGFPTLVVTLAGGKVTEAKGWPNDKNEAKAFALVLREKIGI